MIVTSQEKRKKVLDLKGSMCMAWRARRLRNIQGAGLHYWNSR